MYHYLVKNDKLEAMQKYQLYYDHIQQILNLLPNMLVLLNYFNRKKKIKIKIKICYLIYSFN